jgi:hypothetical protein
MKTRSKKIISCLALLGLLAACGKADKEVSDSDRMIDDAEEAAARAAHDGSNIQGFYVATFQTLNGHVNGNVPGSTVIRRKDNNISIYLRFSLGSPSAAHFQNIHVGKRCPNLSDDTNGDGYIDINEALAVVGPVLIPLDADLNSQAGASRFWPKAFLSGSYEYMKSASFSHMWADLKAKDKNTDDNITKLAEGEGFPVTGRVVMVQGVSEKPIFNGPDIENSPLPDTVGGYKRYKNWQTFPVTCGVFMPDDGIKGTLHEEGIPAGIPVGPVLDNDAPAPDGAGEIAGTGVIIPGPTNDAGSNDADSTSNDPSTTTGGSTTGGTTGSTVGGSSGGTTSSSTGSTSHTTGGSTGGTTGGTTGDYGDDDDDSGDGWHWPWEHLPRIVGGSGSGAR